MGTNWRLTAPLSQKQTTVWLLMRRGLTATAIAQKLKTTRQFVNQTKLAAEARLSATLLDVAQANHIHVIRLSPRDGILLGYHPGLKQRAIVSYSTKSGIKVWYWYDNPEEVTDQEFLSQTRAYLLDIANERDIEIKNAATMHPAKFAHALFSELIPELRT